MATNFPNQTFPTMQNITTADAPLIAQYQSAMQAGNFGTASQILASIANGANKIMTADFVNTITDTNVAIQKFYTTRYSPAYIVSQNQPVMQETSDFWFQITN